MATPRDNRLTARMQVKQPGYYGDGGGLVLRVADSGSKVWLFRYKTEGRRADSVQRFRDWAAERTGVPAKSPRPL
jgi:hypothetical protein